LQRGHLTNERGKLAQVLVLAEDQRYVNLALVGCIKGIEREPHVDPLLFSVPERVWAEARNLHGLVAVDERAAVDGDATAAHDGELVRPEAVPKSVFRWRRDARVELHPVEPPCARRADSGCELLHVVVRKGIAESVADVMEKVLAVDECDGAFNGRFGRHEESQKNNPTEALGRVSRVGSNTIIGRFYGEINGESPPLRGRSLHNPCKTADSLPYSPRFKC